VIFSLFQSSFMLFEKVIFEIVLFDEVIFEIVILDKVSYFKQRGFWQSEQFPLRFNLKCLEKKNKKRKRKKKKCLMKTPSYDFFWHLTNKKERKKRIKKERKKQTNKQTNKENLLCLKVGYMRTWHILCIGTDKWPILSTKGQTNIKLIEICSKML